MTAREPLVLSDDELDEYEEFKRWKLQQATRAAAQAAVDVDPDGEDDDDTGPGAPAGADPDAITVTRAPTKTTLRTKLHIGHFAFMRSYVEGLDIRERWDHYMSQHGAVTDVRAVNSALRRLRADLAAAARRFDRHGMARLLRLDLQDIGLAPPAVLPTLEDFAVASGLEDFPVDEQLRAYQEEYGSATKRQVARARLLARQLAALRWLEGLAVARPKADDAVGAWLIPELAEPIEAAGMVTLRQLAERINGMGMGWSASVKGIGAGKAARVVAWLREVAADTTLTIGAHAEVPRRRVEPEMLAGIVAPATAVVPPEKFIVPPALDGREGQFRRPAAQCALGVDTDLDALLAYVLSKPRPGEMAANKAAWQRANPGQPLPDVPLAPLMFVTPTARAYFNEVYRFMLWAILERKKAVSSIDFADACAFRDFLADPQPSERWCNAARGRERFGPAWRPFAGPLGAEASARAITILGAFYGFLNTKGYMVINPFAGVSKPNAAPAAADAVRSLTAAEWRHVTNALDALPSTSANLRLRFGLRFMYATGLRRAEAVAAVVGQLRHVVFPPDDTDPETVEGWELQVVGKGNVKRVVPVPPGVIDDLVDYLVSRGLPPDLQAPENRQVHLLGQAIDVGTRAPWSTAAKAPVDPQAGIGAQTWYDQMTAFFKKVGEQLANTDPGSAEQLKRASTHWLRHTKVSHSLQAGTRLDVEREIAGHQSIGTTSGYSHAEAKARMRGSQKFFDSWGVRRS